MPTTVAEVFAAADLTPEGVVRWDEIKDIPKVSGQGVYVIALTKLVDRTDRTLPVAPLSSSQFDHWLGVRPELTLDGVRRPTAQKLQDRIQRFWIPDETILYIGQTTSSLASRLADYYDTPIGKRAPHSGGYFLKLLSNCNKLWVHYAECPDPKSAENEMLRRFCDNVSHASKQLLLDRAHPFPFANLEWPRPTRKAHGLRGAREPKRRPSTRQTGKIGAATPESAFSSPFLGPIRESGGRKSRVQYRTQKVLASDLSVGRIRIPRVGAAATKTLFPKEKKEIEVVLRGALLRVSWNPQTGPDKERSGILTRFGDKLRELVSGDEELNVSVNELGMLSID